MSRCIDCGRFTRAQRPLDDRCHDRRTGRITAALTKAYREADHEQAATQGVRTAVGADRAATGPRDLMFLHPKVLLAYLADVNWGAVAYVALFLAAVAFVLAFR